MSKVIVRPATAEDFANYTASVFGEVKPVPLRARAFAGVVDGRVIGIGGIGFAPDGTRVAFADLTDEARKYPVALHRAAKMTLDLAARLGCKRLIATASDHEHAVKWLLRLGFKHTRFSGIDSYVYHI